MKIPGRYIATGALCTVVQYLFVLAFKQFAPVAVVNLLGFIASAQLNFYLSYTWTFSRSARKRGWRLLQTWASFQGVVVAASIVNTVIVWYLNDMNKVWLWASVVIATVISSGATFLVNRYGLLRPSAHSIEDLIRNDSLPASIILERRRDPTTIPGVAMFFPGKNEGANLFPLMSEAAANFEYRGDAFTLIPVDDGSTDNTVAVVNDFKEIYGERVQLVSHKVNRGYGAALRTGLTAGEKTRHEWVGFCDADRQFNPAQISKLIEAAENADADIAIGHRLHRADGLKRKLMGRAWHMLSHAILGFDAKDIDCGFKVFRREAVQDILPDLQGDHAVISPEIMARAKRAGHKIVEVGVDHFPRTEGEQTGAKPRVIVGSLKGLIDVRLSIRSTARRSKHPVTTA